jgi:arylsulfatase A-like enzyme
MVTTSSSSRSSRMNAKQRCKAGFRSRSLVPMFVASMLAATAEAASWPSPSTPTVLPRPEAPFTGKIGRYVTGSVQAWPQPVTAPKGAPNVVIILIDDAGFAATDLFGGPIQTPAIDDFAKDGLRYNDFNVTAICSPTRAALLSGRNSHVVGVGNVMEVEAGYPGYNMIWKQSTACVAEVLRDNGYSTAAFGKWHDTPYWEISPVGPFNHWPTGLGFEYFYGFMSAMDSQYEPRLYENTMSVMPPKSVAQGYYFTTDITNHAIAWLRTHESLDPSRPYFLYFATGATHEPHQVERQWIAKYAGRYHMGWDRLRQEIFERQKALGVIPENTDLTPRPKELPAWDSLTPGEKRLAERQMAVYAGFMAETDYQIGRLLKVIESQPDGSNTLIFYILGDNGASGEGGLEGTDNEAASAGHRESVATMLEHLRGLGGPNYSNNYSAGWAWALDTPFRWMKQIASYFGGTRDPMIVVWPARIKDHGGLRTQFTDVDDLVPTIYQVSGITAPTTVNGVKQLPLNGTSLAYTFTNPSAPSRHKLQYFETFGNRAIYDDGWVASARHGVPWQALQENLNFALDHWKLFHVATDFSEAHNLAAKYPQKLAELRKVFDSEAWKNDVYPIGASQKYLGGPYYLSKGRTDFTFYPSLPPTPVTSIPIFRGQYEIVAELDIPRSRPQGVIVSYGSRTGGFSLYAKDGYLIYDNNAGFSHTAIRSDVPLRVGKAEVTFTFTPSSTNSHWPFGSLEGTGKLAVNGRLVGEGTISPMPIVQLGTLDIGRSYDSAVSAAYSGRFPFTGSVSKVTVHRDLSAASDP